MQQFVETEQLFDSVDDFQSRSSEAVSTTSGVILSLRDVYKDDAVAEIPKIVLSHMKILPRVEFIMAILEHLTPSGEGGTMPEPYHAILRRFTTMNHSNVAPVALKAREMIISSHLPSVSERQT